ncbi:hypothetical protein O0L34_g11401 [Tuta absoluta]|nr:hypothetical protein O0L34_g11401 [Tuta absoluta]
MSLSSLTIEDVLAVVRGKKKVDKDAVLPFVLLPVLLLVGTISLSVTIVVMVVTAMGTLYVISRPREKNRSPFFFSWTICSILTMYLVYQLFVLKLLQVTVLENIATLVLVLCTLYFFYKMKTCTGYYKEKEYSPVLTSDSYYCQICQIEVNERFFHSIWWDCCVSKPNYIYFLAGQIFALVTLLHGTNLGLTSVCDNSVYYGNILLPDQCNQVYNHALHYIFAFVTCIYGLGYTLIVIMVLLKQIFVYIPKYTEMHWRKHVNVQV